MGDSNETARDLRKKLKRLQDSRDDWKKKQREKQYELKIEKSKVTAALESRDRWKVKSKENEGELGDLRKLAIEKEKELEDCQTRLEQISDENKDLKKNTSADIFWVEFRKNT